MHNFRKLNVYEKAIEAGCEVRSMVRSFPKEEMFALSQQLRRAVDSIALYIAEGSGNNSEKEFSRFLEYSIRSAYECICCLDIALKNSFIQHDVYDRLYSRIDEIIAMLIGLQRKIKE